MEEHTHYIYIPIVWNIYSHYNIYIWNHMDTYIHIYIWKSNSHLLRTWHILEEMNPFARVTIFDLPSGKLT